jgi:Icc-related predicted phosphoesterase
MKVAAVGDLHVGATGGGRNQSFIELFEGASRNADLLLLCGDLTNVGAPEEARRLAEDLRHCSIPFFGVLGNHDFEEGKEEEVEEILCAAGMRPLETRVQEHQGVGVVGVKGFGGGFGRNMLGSFGEPAAKAFVAEAMREAQRLEHALQQVSHFEKVVVTLHYAPIAETMEGEPHEIFPYLGSSRLEEVINRFDNIKAVFHGHGHRGTYESKTSKGIPVYNCALHIEKPSGKSFALVEI